MDWTKAQIKLGVTPDNKPGPLTYKALFDYAAGRKLGDTSTRLGRSAAEALPRFQATSPYRIADLLSQTAVESNYYRSFEENLNYSSTSALKTWPSHFNASLAQWAHRNPERIAEVAYGVRSRKGHGRMGNTKPGEGYKYRGRGLLQLTGKDNYALYGKLLGLPLVQNPDLASDPETSLLIALQYYKMNNIFALSDKRDWIGSRRKVNGGTHGLAHVNDVRNKILALFN